MTKPTYDELLARVAQLEQQLQQCSAQAGALAVTNEAFGTSAQLERKPPEQPAGWAEDAALHASSLLRRTFDAIPDLLTVHDRDLRVVLSNWHGRGHVTPEERNSRPHCYSCYMRREQPCEPCPTLEVFRTGAAARTEVKNPFTGRTLEVNAYPVTDEAGAVSLVTEHVRDITERMRAEHDLEASETRYRRLFEAAKDGILILDADTGKITDVNPFLLELTGFARDDFLGAFLWEIGPFKDTAASKDSFAALLTNKYARYDDLPLQARDGRRIPVEFVSNVYLVDGQNVIQCNIWDITERKRADQTEETLRRSEEKFRILFDQAADCILLLEITPEGIPVIRDANSATFRLLGYERDELIGQPVSLIDAAPDVSKAVGERRRDVISGATSMFEVSHRCKDGAIRDFECSVTEMQVASVTFAISVERDITARKQAEAERNRLEEQLRAAQKMEAIGGLAGGIAHDFNNLLSVILSFTGFAMDAVREGGPLRDDLLEVKKAGERAAVLTRQLLAFSRKQVLRAVPVNLNEIAAAVEKMLRRILGEDIDFVQVLAPDLGLTRADPGQINSIA